MNAVAATPIAPDRSGRLLDALAQILPADCVLSRPEQTVPFDCDGLAAFRQTPPNCGCTEQLVD